VRSFSGFFFQAEDGIRDFHVTGVQTCALPISDRGLRRGAADGLRRNRRRAAPEPAGGAVAGAGFHPARGGALTGSTLSAAARPRSEERRVGKEWRARGASRS